MRARGFTLIEVLVALAIVAIGMAAVLETLTSSADTVVYLRDKTFANWIALNQIALQRLAGQQPAQGTSDGEVDFAGRKWRWRQEVTGAQLPGVARLDVSVRPADLKADKDRGWYTTLTGIWGDAVAAPRGDLPDWGSQLLAAPAATAPGTRTTPATPAGPGGASTPPAQPRPQGTP